MPFNVRVNVEQDEGNAWLYWLGKDAKAEAQMTDAGEPINYILVSEYAVIVNAAVDRSMFSWRYPSDHYLCGHA